MNSGKEPLSHWRTVATWYAGGASGYLCRKWHGLIQVACWTPATAGVMSRKRIDAVQALRCRTTGRSSLVSGQSDSAERSKPPVMLRSPLQL